MKERNRTLRLSDSDRQRLSESVLTSLPDSCEGIVNADAIAMLPLIPDESVDLIIADPPYNLTKDYCDSRFAHRNSEKYNLWLQSWLPELCRKLKPTGTLYLCSDWQTSLLVQPILAQHLLVLNRITWQREKGRGSIHNWKNCHEDIWMAVKDRKRYKFYAERVKLLRPVIAPYRVDGQPKDWQESDCGNVRLTYPSNLWDDITIPFWSMAENTDHPTQKPEKLIARLMLASSDEGDLVLDPFAGSGTTPAVAVKLGRRCLAIEKEKEYVLLGMKRMELAFTDKHIQGYMNGYFVPRNHAGEKPTRNEIKQIHKIDENHND